MTKYSYTVHRPTSVMTIWRGDDRVCIISDVTQRRQAKHLFEEYIKKHEVD